MTIVKGKEAERMVREGGKRLAFVLREVAKAVKPGITGKELDDLAEKLIREGGDTPAFLNYTPEGEDLPYPATLCVSVNSEVVHGIPDAKKLCEGDIVGLDLGLRHGDYFVDAAMTVPVGKVDEKAKRLINITKKSLETGISKIKTGVRLGDISAAIEKEAARGPYGVGKVLGGHGVGRHVHETPYIPNFGKAGTGPRLLEGMLLAIEPMFNEGSPDVFVDKNDGYTFRTADGSRSAHFEHTVLVTKFGAVTLTA